MNENRPSIEKIAPTVEEATAQGLAELNLSENDVEIEVLDEGSKGLLGIGSRQARVRLIIKEDDKPELAGDSPIEDELEPEDELVDSTVVESTSEDDFDSEEDDVLILSREVVKDLIEKMKVNAEITAKYEEPDDEYSQPSIYVDIQGDDLSILIGRKAETINALQYIAKLIIGKELERAVPIIVDVKGYRKRREMQIRQLAQRVAEQVRETGRSQALEPMPPDERRLVHIELRNNPDVYTESTDEGYRRKVVIYPQK